MDAGLSYKRIEERAHRVGESLEGLSAVFITHEHGDHVQAAGTISRKFGVPVFMTQGTFDHLPQKIGPLKAVELFEAGESLDIGDMRINSFSVSHDAADPVSYTITCAGAKIGFATDLGHCCNLVRTRLAGSNALVLESNYCPDRLMRSEYPPKIQQRIRSRQGHLSNQDAASLLNSLLHKALRTVVLVHLSENNNCPDLVKSMATGALNGHPTDLFISLRDEPTPLFEVGP